ncbi:little elongation complex subunit 2 [Spea bombifrons]|uniref:little elongation complex subunit 2 n=1 Tax=Spea bombifrons TaxID=233779 RepID=UPI002348FBE9|nr:little elongation complex subunit 2 [Spea bombifrons]
MEGPGQLKWDIVPQNGRNCFFTQASYEKYSLEPTLAELFLLANKAETSLPKACKTDERLPDSEPSDPEKADEVKCTADGPALPEPRVAYPRFSLLTEFEQKSYVHLMIKYHGKKDFVPRGLERSEYKQYEFLKSRVSSEYAEFQKFLQQSARSCAEDYNWLSADAQLYTQELLKACQRYVKTYPECYTLHEVTSILGGKFIPNLTLKLEKSLLTMGSAPFVKVTFPTVEMELPTTFKRLSSNVSPASKAALMHTTVSSDPNATKLATKYRPQVVLTSQVLYTLLNNHGTSYKEQWEIPLRVETITSAGGKQAKIAYMDSPLPKKELSMREKSQMFHEVSLDLIMLKKSGVVLKAMKLDRPEFETYSRSRMQEPCEGMEVDFESDLTELETFGAVETPSKASKTLESVTTNESIHTSINKSLLEKLKQEKQVTNRTISEDDKNISAPTANTSIHSLWSDSDGTDSFKGFESDEIRDCMVSEENSEDDSGSDKKSKNVMQSFSKPTLPVVAKQPCTMEEMHSDSEEERLVIDIDLENNSKEMNVSMVECSTPLSPPQSQPKKTAKRFSKQFDPVGEILKMQTLLLKPESKKSQEAGGVSQERSGQLLENTVPVQVSSSKELSEVDEDIHRIKSLNQPPDIKKSLLPDELLKSIEDEAAYTVKPEDNCAYRLFSLDDMLLLIQSRVQKALTQRRAKDNSTRKHIPVYVLTKMDYQCNYGAEVLTESETCRLWTESLVHPSTLFYIGHIDALTSKFFLLEEIHSEALKDRLGNINPTNSLVILRHILKRVTGLQDGTYLLSHASGDSSVHIYKSISEMKRGGYNLHRAHSSLPKAPSSLSVPWVPLDPNILLPCHTHNGWPPCTFPPQLHMKTNIQENKGTRSKVFKKDRSSSKPAPKAAKGQAPKKKNKGQRLSRLKRWNETREQWKAKAKSQTKT